MRAVGVGAEDDRDSLQLENADLRIELHLMTKDRDRLAEALREAAETLCAEATIESEWVLPVADDLRATLSPLDERSVR